MVLNIFINFKKMTRDVSKRAVLCCAVLAGEAALASQQIQHTASDLDSCSDTDT